MRSRAGKGVGLFGDEEWRIMTRRTLIRVFVVLLAVAVAVPVGWPAVAAGERGGQSKIKLPNPPRWRSGSISRGADGQLFVDTSAKSLNNIDPKRFAFLKDYRSTIGLVCQGLKSPSRVEARAPAHVKSIVHSLAPKYDLDPLLVLAVIAVESNFHTKAVSPKNAQGLMQLIPDTARRFGVRDPFDPSENIRGGMRYLQWLLQTFNGDLALALAGYNAGEKAVQKYRGVPPYSETRNYVKKVHTLYGCETPRRSTKTTAVRPSGGNRDVVEGWPPVREPYDVWNAAASSIDRDDDGRCRFRIRRDSGMGSSAGTLICR